MLAPAVAHLAHGKDPPSKELPSHYLGLSILPTRYHDALPMIARRPINGTFSYLSLTQVSQHLRIPPLSANIHSSSPARPRELTQHTPLPLPPSPEDPVTVSGPRGPQRRLRRTAARAGPCERPMTDSARMTHAWSPCSTAPSEILSVYRSRVTRRHRSRVVDAPGETRKSAQAPALSDIACVRGCVPGCGGIGPG